MNPESIHIETDPETLRFSSESISKLELEKCGRRPKWLNGYFIANMWNRIENSFQMATKAEHKMGHQYSAMIKMRPDLFFVRPMSATPILDQIDQNASNSTDSKFQGLLHPLNSLLLRPARDFKANETAFDSEREKSQQELEDDLELGVGWDALTPPGNQVNNGGFNDWAAVCVRSKCESFFRLIESYAQCRTSSSDKSKKVCCAGLGGSEWIYRAFNATDEAFEDNESQEVFPVTICRLRQGELSLECHRIKDEGLKKACNLREMN